MDYYDLFIFPMYLLPILILAKMIAYHFYGNSIHAKYFMQGLIIKIFGAVVAGLLYQFYYGGGDTFNFYAMTEVFWEAFTGSDPTKVWELLMLNSGEYQTENNDLTFYISKFYSWYFREPAAFIVSKIGGFIGLFCFNSYSVIAMMFAVISFSGLWLLYRTFTNILPNLHKQFALGILFMPSVIFWGSGLFKDTLTIGALGLFTFCSYKLFIRRKLSISAIILLMISFYIMYVIKLYIALSFIPALILYIFNSYRERINNVWIKQSITPIILISTIIVSFQLIKNLGESNAKYSLDTALSTIQQTQEWHTKISKQGRTYSLGSYEQSYTGILSKLPSAIIVSLFRPFIWEANGLLLLISSVENLFLLYLFIKMVIKLKIKDIIPAMKKYPILWICLIFTISLSFIIGFTTYNFGALVRYKIPIIPFYIAGLYIMLSYHEQKSQSRIAQ